jgi:hypothetical protein
MKRKPKWETCRFSRQNSLPYVYCTWPTEHSVPPSLRFTLTVLSKHCARCPCFELKEVRDAR